MRTPSSHHSDRPVAIPRLPSVRELASGIDALYLSGRTEFSDALFDMLEDRRQAATETDSPAAMRIAGEDFGVEPRSFGKYRYRLVHHSGLIGVTASEHLPSLRVQPRAEFLHAVGPRATLDFFSGIGEYLSGGRPVSWTLSRLDLFCDLQGWELRGDDRHRFVCRGMTRTTHEQSEEFTGFEFGKRSSKTVCARIYDKTKQISDKGLDWWPQMWGDRFNSAEPVVRIEFEVGRQGLVEFGIRTPHEGIEAAPRLWASVTADWLSYRTRTADRTKSRWPVAPEWTDVQGASLAADAIGLERVRSGRRQGELRKLLPHLVGYLASTGAIIGTDDLPSTLGAVRSLVASDEIRRGVDFSDRIAERAAARTYA
jgi:hypothetical protein